MQRLLLAFTALLLLLTPASAQDVQSIDDFKAEHSSYSLSDLESRAAELVTILKVAQEKYETATADALAATDDADLQKASKDAEVNRDLANEQLLAIASLIDEKDGDESAFQASSIEITGKVSADNMSVGAAAGLLSKWMTQAKDIATAKGPGWIFNVVLFLLIIFVFRLLANIAGRVTGKALSTSRLKVSDILRTFFTGIVRKLIFIVGLVIALGQIGVDTGPLLAGVGVVGFVVGFALQETLANFAAGIMILLYRPFDLGDWITAGGETGKVDGMSLVSTTILTGDNQKLIMPNSAIWGGTIRNITAMPTRRVDMVIGVGYDADLDQTMEVLMGMLKDHELVLANPEPVVSVTNLGDSSVDFNVRPWVKAADYWTLYWDLTKTIKQRLDQEGISIPFPQRDLHLVTIPDELKTAVAN